MLCVKCGAPVILVKPSERRWKQVCLKCGRREELEAKQQVNINIDAGQIAYRGYNFFRTLKFDDAEKCFQAALKRQSILGYLWAKLICRYGVQYCEETDGSYTVCLWKKEPPVRLLKDTTEYEKIIESAAYETELLEAYRKNTEEIDKVLSQISKSRNNKYDIFLSFKDDDGKGNRTPERGLLENVYKELLKKGIRNVFFSPESMYGKGIDNYPGYIHCAIASARLMVVVTSSRQNICSPWVKSEWERFLLWNENQSQSLMVCTTGIMRTTELPEELKTYQIDYHVQETNQSDAKLIAGDIEKRLNEIRKPRKAEEEYQKGVQCKEAKDKVKFFENAAELEHAAAQCRLGDCYYCGYGVDEDKEKAVRLYAAAAEQSDANAQFKLGDCYYYGYGVPENKKEAVTWYRKAAQQGHCFALYSLGVCYENGHGVEKDPSEAVRYYQEAADNGLSLAKDRLRSFRTHVRKA